MKIGILLGDDIGLEVVPECVKVMKAAAARTGLAIDWQPLPIGKSGHEQHGNTLPPVTEQALRGLDGWIMGPIGNAAAFNIKEECEAVIDRCTIYDCEIGLRLRGPSRVRVTNLPSVRPVRCSATARRSAPCWGSAGWERLPGPSRWPWPTAPPA